MQEDILTHSLCLPESRKEISVKGTLVESGDRTPLSPGMGECRRRSLYKPALLLLLIYYPQAQTLFVNRFFLLIERPKYVFVLSSPHKFILCLKSIKAACFGHFLGLISMRPPCTQLKFLFLLLICFVSVLLLVQPRTQDGEGRISPSLILCYKINHICHPLLYTSCPFWPWNLHPDSLISATRPWISHQSQ